MLTFFDKNLGLAVQIVAVVLILLVLSVEVGLD